MEGCRLRNTGSAQVRILLVRALIISLMFLQGSLLPAIWSPLYRKKKNIEVQRKTLTGDVTGNMGNIFSKKIQILHNKSSIKAMWNRSAGLLTLKVLSPLVPSFLLFCLCVFLKFGITCLSPSCAELIQQWPLLSFPNLLAY